MTQESTESVALVSATGAIGKSVAAALRQKGQPYRAMGQSQATLEKMFGGGPLAESAIWEPGDEASIGSALRPVYFCIQVYEKAMGLSYTH